jgi:two-component system sensor histidine kinase ChvG
MPDMTAEPLDRPPLAAPLRDPAARARGGRGELRAAGWAEPDSISRSARPAGWRFWRSPTLRRVLLVNLVVLAIPVFGLLYLKQYRESLIQAEMEAMATQGRVFALSLGATAVLADQTGRERLVPELTRHQVRLLLTETGLRGRLYAPFEEGGILLVDSYQLAGPNGVIVVDPLVPQEEPGLLDRVLAFIDGLFAWLPGTEDLPAYEDGATQTAADYPEVLAALFGGQEGQARRGHDGKLVLTMAVPVQRYRQVLGALLLTKDGGAIERSVAARRVDVLVIFGVALTVTVLLSLYLAGTIARPIRTLARAADRVKSGKGKKIPLPDYSRRRDEIGELGRALTAMTDTLWMRVDAIEGFAADVAHEIKNPLTSLRSAVETVMRLDDPARIKQLLAIILDDVNRMDRLITDISDASRLDAELARAEAEPFDLRRLLEALVEVHSMSAGETGPRFQIDLAPQSLTVTGLEGRLGQVFRNIIVNAMSFSPPGGTIRLTARRDGESILTTVEDEGPGIPEDKLEAIFDRFYSSRPESEKFGTHSGLGLSISKQIVEAHRGRLWAENRMEGERVLGARFLVRLPAAPAQSARSTARTAARPTTRGRK